MKTVLRLTPAFLCCLLLGAHFLRMGMLWALILCCLFPFVLVLRHPAVRWVVVVVLVLGFATWIFTTLQIAMVRQQSGEPYLRMALILGGVSFFNLLAIVLLFGERMKSYFYPAGPEPSVPEAGG